MKASDPAEQKKLLQEALPHLQKSIELHPTYYDGHLAYGACAYYLEMYDESVNAYRNTSVQYPNDQKALTGLRFALEAKGNEQLLKGDTANAILFLDEAWRIYQPDSSKVWFGRAQHPIK